MLNLDHRSQEQKVLLENMVGSEGRKKRIVTRTLCLDLFNCLQSYMFEKRALINDCNKYENKMKTDQKQKF